jgi:hypothetical protein
LGDTATSEDGDQRELTYVENREKGGDQMTSKLSMVTASLAFFVPLAAFAQSQSGGLPETNARVAVLEATLATLQANLASETAARQAAVTALQNNIYNVQTNITNAINSESAARQAADAALQNSIKNVQNAINSESATRQATDTALQNQLSLIQNATTYFDFKGFANTPNGDLTRVLTSQTLPAGNYLVLFNGTLFIQDTETFGSCDMSKLSNPAQGFSGAVAEIGGNGTLTISGFFELDAPDSIVADCDTTGPHSAFTNLRLIAIPVTNPHLQNHPDT